MSNGNAVERGDDGTDVDDLATLSKLDNQASLWLPSSHVHIIHLYTLKIGKKEKQHLLHILSLDAYMFCLPSGLKVALHFTYMSGG